MTHEQRLREMHTEMRPVLTDEESAACLAGADALRREWQQIATAQRFVTLMSTVWRDTPDGRRAKDLADAEASRLAGEIMGWAPQETA